MNSNYGGKPNSKSSFDFDLGLGSTRPKSLKDQKTPSKPTWQPNNKPSWSHQPAPGSSIAPPASMVGDILGKSWASSGSTTSSSSSSIGIGIVDKNPNLFGDLVSSALGQGNNNNNNNNKSSGSNNVPLKNATPVTTTNNNKSAYSMGNLADSLPKTNNSSKSSATWGSNDSFGSFSVGANSNNKSTNLGGSSMKGMAGGGVGGGGGMSSNKDPFGSLFDFRSKQSGGSLKSATKGSNKANVVADDVFGNFQNASKPSMTKTAFPSSGFSSNNDDYSKLDDFAIPAKNFGAQKQPPVQSSGGDTLDMLFSSSSGGGATASGGAGGQQFSEVDDWGLESDFGGGNDGGPTTTEIEGLPPPPAGVTASSAKNKGIDNQKNGQYADAIKWLSWSVVLLEKAGDKASTTEVLSIRASCYKEVGEYKKAVADCSKVLEHDDANVSVLVQRALLYESMEKYKLGAEDLRTVLKIDPGNRIARSTVHRLTKMAG